MIAYHFVGETLRDGSPVPADGVKLVYPGRPVLCQSGLHASVDPWDALKYAPGPILCRVEVGGTVEVDSDKVVGTERTILERRDATAMLWRFARSQARSVVHLWDAPEVVRRYLESGDETLRDAAWDAANAAARDADRDAAWDAASAAARDASWDAAWAAAWAAASAAANAAAWDAARAAAAWDAARAAARAADRAADRAASWDAAWAADRAASWDAARAEYDSMVNDLFGAPEA